MLEVLAQAQAAGQKAQEDSRRGQGSIFDFGGDGVDADGNNNGLAPPRHQLVPAGEFEQNELLRLEKEVLGTFLSAHPLHEVGDALRARVEKSLADVARLADGAWVTVGGIVAEAKKVRTRSGGYVMFAKLDDLEEQVELFVRDAASESAEAIEVDKVVIIRGRVDHKGRDQMSVVVQEAERFEPDEMEIARARQKAEQEAGPLLLRIDAAQFPESLVDELKTVFETHPGDNEVLLEMRTRERVVRLRFGDGFKVADSPSLRADLDQLLGPTALAA
jgi:DNA polymerase-3 subunit alpha